MSAQQFGARVANGSPTHHTAATKLPYLLPNFWKPCWSKWQDLSSRPLRSPPVLRCRAPVNGRSAYCLEIEAVALGQEMIRAAKGRELILTAHSWNLFGIFRRTSMFVV